MQPLIEFGELEKTCTDLLSAQVIGNLLYELLHDLTIQPCFESASELSQDTLV